MVLHGFARQVSRTSATGAPVSLALVQQTLAAKLAALANAALDAAGPNGTVTATATATAAGSPSAGASVPHYALPLSPAPPPGGVKTAATAAPNASKEASLERKDKGKRRGGAGAGDGGETGGKATSASDSAAAGAKDGARPSASASSAAVWNSPAASLGVAVNLQSLFRLRCQIAQFEASIKPGKRNNGSSLSPLVAGAAQRRPPTIPDVAASAAAAAASDVDKEFTAALGRRIPIPLPMTASASASATKGSGATAASSKASTSAAGPNAPPLPPTRHNMQRAVSAEQLWEQERQRLQDQQLSAVLPNPYEVVAGIGSGSSGGVPAPDNGGVETLMQPSSVDQFVPFRVSGVTSAVK